MRGRVITLIISISVVFCSCGPSKNAVHASREAASPAYKPPKKRDLKKKYAAIMDVQPKHIRDVKLYYFVDEWYGVKYKWGGNEKSGVDCSGLVCRLYDQVYGLKIQRTVAEQHDSNPTFRKRKRFREGDLVYFRTEGKDPTHVGVYLKNNFFLHASKSKGVMISNLSDNYWKKTYTGGGKVRKKKPA